MLVIKQALNSKVETETKEHKIYLYTIFGKKTIEHLKITL